MGEGVLWKVGGWVGGRFGGPFWRFEMGLGDPQGGPGLVGRTARRSGTGREVL